VCHGIPGPNPLREGDIVNIDVTLIVDGWHGDTSRMYAVGRISRRAERSSASPMRPYSAALRQSSPAPQRAYRRRHPILREATLQRRFVISAGRARQVFHDRPTFCTTASRRRRGFEARHAVHHRAHD